MRVSELGVVVGDSSLIMKFGWYSAPPLSLLRLLLLDDPSVWQSRPLFHLTHVQI